MEKKGRFITKKIKEVKDWIIKRLGGYTEREYQDINKRPNQEFPVRMNYVEQLIARIKINKDVLWYIEKKDDYILDMLEREFVKLIKRKIKITYRHSEEGEIVVEGTIEVLR